MRLFRGRERRAEPETRQIGIKIRVDPERCTGHSRCYGLVPELFEIDDYGQSTAVGDGSVPPDLVDRARLAIANCPEGAIEEIVSGPNEP